MSFDCTMESDDNDVLMETYVFLKMVHDGTPDEEKMKGPLPKILPRLRKLMQKVQASELQDDSMIQ